jgi:hypothetical protein
MKGYQTHIIIKLYGIMQFLLFVDQFYKDLNE